MVKLYLTDSSLTFATVGDGMVAPPFILECITPNCLAHGNEGEATPTTTVGILRPLIYGGDSTDLQSTRNIV